MDRYDELVDRAVRNWEGPDLERVAHYGDPMAEQRALVAGHAVVVGLGRDVVQVSGPDRLTWLQVLVTQDLLGLRAAESTEALVLSPRGHIEHHLKIIADDDSLWLLCEQGTAAALVDWLHSMKFMNRVQVQDRSADFEVIGATAPLSPAPGRQFTSAWPGVVGDSASYALEGDHPGTGLGWWEYLCPRAEVSDWVRSWLAADPDCRQLAGTWAAEAYRVSRREPRLATEVDHRTIPHELDWLRTTTHLRKGCYRGQETVARVHNLGRPPRRLVFLHLDGSGHELPEVGAELIAADRSIGRMTSVVRHFEDGPCGLGVVKRSSDPTLPLLVAGIPVTQETIVAP